MTLPATLNSPADTKASLKNKVEAHKDNVYNSLFEYFRSYTKFPLALEDQPLIRDAFKLKKLRRHQFVL